MRGTTPPEKRLLIEFDSHSVEFDGLVDGLYVALANALIAGNKVMLNPLSVEGLRGVNVAAGISGLQLEYTPGRGRDLTRPLPLPR